MNLSITNECNRRCEYCFQKSWYLANKKEDIKEMSLENIEKIIDMMGEEKHFKIMGGEPLLYSKLFELLELIRKKEKTITFISNITVQTETLEKILVDYADVVKGWLINTDYPDTHKKIFSKNISLFKKDTNISLSSTLLPDTSKILESANRILGILDILKREDISIRISPMAPNHKDNHFYDYTMDIIKFIDCIWNKSVRKISFDCPLNACEVHPELMDMFDSNDFIEYKNEQCIGCGAFDILVDNSVIYCSSTYNHIRLENIFDYENIIEARESMSKQRKLYWKYNKMNCDYKTCEHFSPAYCQGLCPAKNIIKTNLLV